MTQTEIKTAIIIREIMVIIASHRRTIRHKRHFELEFISDILAFDLFC